MLNYLVAVIPPHKLYEQLSTAIPTIMLLIPSMLLLVVHHQMLCYCDLAKPDPCRKSKSPVSQDYVAIQILFDS